MVKPMTNWALFGYLGMCILVPGLVVWSGPEEQNSPGISANDYRVSESVGHAHPTLRSNTCKKQARTPRRNEECNGHMNNFRLAPSGALSQGSACRSGFAARAGDAGL